jgi:hypothetical protein
MCCINEICDSLHGWIRAFRSGLHSMVIVGVCYPQHNPVKTNLFDLVASATCVCFCSKFKNKICSCSRTCVCVQNIYKDTLNEAGSPLSQFQSQVQVLEDNHKLLACTGGAEPSCGSTSRPCIFFDFTPHFGALYR